MPRRPAPVAALLLAAGVAPAAQDAAAQDAAPAPAEAVARLERRARALLEAERAAGRFAGGSAALLLPDGSVLTVAVGLADPAEQRALTPADRMPAGSIGKTFVAASALRLAAAGALDLDATACALLGAPDWLERLPNGPAVTLRQLLRHQSGLPRYVFEPAFWAALRADPDRSFAPVELLGFVFDRPPLFAPGAGWAYSDTNYILLGMALEAALGEPLEGVIRARLLAPLGLDATQAATSRDLAGLAQGESALLPDLGFPARTLEGGRFVLNPQFEWCGGGYVSTPRDLAVWARALFGDPPDPRLGLDAPTRAAQLEGAPAPLLGPGARYGLGAILRATRAGPLVGHDGTFPGYTSTMGAFPALGLAAAFQVNRDGPETSARPLFELLVDLALAAAEELGLPAPAGG